MTLSPTFSTQPAPPSVSSCGHVEIVITGRYAEQTLIECADLVTEMREAKHPCRRGIPARRGIEF